MVTDTWFRDERGFTTAGMAVALLVALALLFSTAQVYRVNSQASEIQNVADAVALAAENEVGEFMIAVRLCDSVVLSMSLLGVSCYGLGVVALCVPPTAEVGATLIEAGAKTLKARDGFAERAAQGLNQLQKALPFVAAAQGAAVAAANGKQRPYGYYAMGLLVASEGKPIVAGSNAAEGSLQDAVDDKRDALAEAAAKAEEATRDAQAAKRRAFMRDCGDNPSYCLYERAAHLAGLGSGANPLYHSVDAWSFSVPLERARAYYRARLSQEAPQGASVEEGARSALRKRFYVYASNELARAFVHETADGFEASFPRFPRNTEQMKKTVLYTEAVYPITSDEEGSRTMHAWSGCPEAQPVTAYGSASLLDAEEFETCSACQFKVSLLGSVAAASTSIDNGFEYHYDAIARAAEEYEKALKEAKPLKRAVKADAGSLLDKALAALKGAASRRITAQPPGSSGCIALVVSPQGSSTGVFESAFVRQETVLGTRAALSAATLVEDTTDDASVVGNLLDGFKEGGSPVAGAGRVVLQCWSSLLDAYSSGQKALSEGIENALNGLPLVGSSGLGTWAAHALEDRLKDVGLEPARDAPLKPVLVNSAAVAQADGGDFAVRFQRVKQQVLSSPASTTDPFVALADHIDREAYDRLGQEIEIARIEVPLVGLTVPVTVTLPSSVRDGAAGLVEKATDLLRSLNGSLSGVRAWG
ncbi:MAG: molybdenum cofactor biosynthesis enzyme [Adlercreutzia sp.]|nr:molybdenum cofactor biosynthesis enzyme [Adlercreutzia sp.]